MRQLWCVMLLQTFVAVFHSGSTSTVTTQPTSATEGTTTKTTTKASVSSPSTTTVTVVPTTITTVSSAATASTEAPALGVDCTNKTEQDNWCNTTISGEAECGTDGVCHCVSGYFQSNVRCIPDTDLVPISLPTSDITTSSFNIAWSTSDSVKDLTLSYTVSCEGECIGVSCVVHSSNTEANCSGLAPGYQYKVNVTATFTDVYNSTHSGFNVIQESTFPDIPGSLDGDSSSFAVPNVTLVWTNSSVRVDFYTLIVTQSDTSEVMKNHSTVDEQAQIAIVGLTAGTNYTVLITANSYGKASQGREDTFRTLTAVPGPPVKPTIVSYTNDTVKIRWNMTDQPNGDVQGHKVCVMYRLYNDDETFKTLGCENTTDAYGLEYERTGLFAGTFYKFDVYTINDMYISNSTSIEQRTKESGPGKVSGLKATPNDTLIKVTWKRPSQPNGDIIMYQIDWIGLTDQKNCSDYLKSQTSTAVSNATCYHNILDSGSITDNQVNMEYTIVHLMPHTEYRIQVRGFTSVGQGDVDSKTTQTSISVPDPVMDVTAVVINATAVNVSWTIPAVNPGPVNYTVMTNNMVDSHSSQQSCSVQDYSSSSCVVPGLEEYWVYSFTVVASTDAGSSNPTMSENITTVGAEPGQISKFSYKLYNRTDCDATKVLIHWEEPALLDRNSLITQYRFHVQGSVKCEYMVSNPDPYSEPNKEFEKNCSGLDPEKSHAWTMYAVSKDNKIGQDTGFTATQGVCAPPNWANTDIELVKESMSTTSSVTIMLPSTFFKKTEQGSIQEKGVIVLPKESNFFKETSSIVHGDLKDWKTAHSYQFVKEYKVIFSESISGSLVIGADSGCSTSEIQDKFCNGPLPEQFSFKLAAYVCTRRRDILLCTISSPFGSFATQAKPVPPSGSDDWVIAVSVLMVLGAVIGAFAFLWYKGVIDPKSWLPARTGEEEEPPFTPIDTIERKRPIPLSHYSTILEEMHRDTNLQLSDQYDDINKIGQIVAEISTTNTAKMESNTPKNRWVNILPYDHSRVKLQQIDEDDPTSDYINANYIPGFYNKREYIATQGPLPGTIDDFWRMVWEHNVLVIVMLTQCKEGNRVKCEKYWPDELREPKQYGEVVVNPTSISQLDKYNISIFDVSVNGQQSHQVIHFHYLDFPDFSANVEFDHFINFVRTVRSHVPHDMTGPMVIHCSAGVGRTGTFIATDRLNLYLNSPKFDENDEVDIFGMVVSMRENRVAMVQTESQYIMIHDCFEKMLEDKKKSMQMTDSEENLYANQGYDPYPEVLYENVPRDQQQTEL